jgi:xanthine dehydrogenase accessory factor
VRREAIEALRTRRARLVSIRPDAAEARASSPEHVIVAMRCASEGAVDVFVEPFVQVRKLVVVGATPVAEALVRVARSIDCEVVWSVAGPDRHDIQPRAEGLGANVIAIEELAGELRTGNGDLAAVVASQGHDDEVALETILKSGVTYVGLVASRKRGATIRTALEDRGVPGVSTIHSPAGLDLGARVPAEVALSVLAEVVKESPSQSPVHGTTCAAHSSLGEGGSLPQEGRASAPPSTLSTAARPTPGPTPRAPGEGEAELATDPVCGMQVNVATARHSAVVEGTTYYFCCPHCRADFVQSPDQYLAPHA